MADIRTEIINTVRESFEYIKQNSPSVSTKPVQVVSLLDRFTLPTAIADADLPAVSFGYGDSRRLQGAFTQEEIHIFSVHVYPIVPELPGMDLLESASAMEEAIRLIAHDLNAYEIVYDQDEVISVGIGQIFTRPQEFTKYEFMEFRIDFQVAYNIPLQPFI